MVKRWLGYWIIYLVFFLILSDALTNDIFHLSISIYSIVMQYSKIITENMKRKRYTALEIQFKMLVIFFLFLKDTSPRLAIYNVEWCFKKHYLKCNFKRYILCTLILILLILYFTFICYTQEWFVIDDFKKFNNM